MAKRYLKSGIEGLAVLPKRSELLLIRKINNELQALMLILRNARNLEG